MDRDHPTALEDRTGSLPDALHRGLGQRQERQPHVDQRQTSHRFRPRERGRLLGEGPTSQSCSRHGGPEGRGPGYQAGRRGGHGAGRSHGQGRARVQSQHQSGPERGRLPLRPEQSERLFEDQRVGRKLHRDREFPARYRGPRSERQAGRDELVFRGDDRFVRHGLRGRGCPARLPGQPRGEGRQWLAPVPHSSRQPRVRSPRRPELGGHQARAALAQRHDRPDEHPGRRDRAGGKPLAGDSASDRLYGHDPADFGSLRREGEKQQGRRSDLHGALRRSQCRGRNRDAPGAVAGDGLRPSPARGLGLRLQDLFGQRERRGIHAVSRHPLLCARGSGRGGAEAPPPRAVRRRYGQLLRVQPAREERLAGRPDPDGGPLTPKRDEQRTREDRFHDRGRHRCALHGGRKPQLHAREPDHVRNDRVRPRRGPVGIGAGSRRSLGRRAPAGRGEEERWKDREFRHAGELRRRALRERELRQAGPGLLPRRLGRESGDRLEPHGRRSLEHALSRQAAPCERPPAPGPHQREPFRRRPEVPDRVGRRARQGALGHRDPERGQAIDRFRLQPHRPPDRADQIHHRRGHRITGLQPERQRGSDGVRLDLELHEPRHLHLAARGRARTSDSGLEGAPLEVPSGRRLVRGGLERDTA